MRTFLAHGIWLDDLIVPLVVAAAYGIGVLRASVGAPDADGGCPYCGAPDAGAVLGGGPAGPVAPSDADAEVVRCARCGFRLAARLSPSVAASVAPGEATR